MFAVMSGRWVDGFVVDQFGFVATHRQLNFRQTSVLVLAQGA
jgi:hypothetical protein